MNEKHDLYLCGLDIKVMTKIMFVEAKTKLESIITLIIKLTEIKHNIETKLS